MWKMQLELQCKHVVLETRVYARLHTLAQRDILLDYKISRNYGNPTSFHCSFKVTIKNCYHVCKNLLQHAQINELTLTHIPKV